MRALNSLEQFDWPKYDNLTVGLGFTDLTPNGDVSRFLSQIGTISGSVCFFDDAGLLLLVDPVSETTLKRLQEPSGPLRPPEWSVCRLVAGRTPT